jgi:putative glutamine amidotransferase
MSVFSPKIAILVRRNYWESGAIPGNANSHRSVPDIMAAILQAGGLPELIFQGSAEQPGNFDGLILPGGGDIDPGFYGQEPGPAVDVASLDSELDAFQIDWTRAALQAGLPLLGICRGMQVLNVAAGGSLVQDLPGEHLPLDVLHDARLRSQAVHAIKVAPGSSLAQLWGATRLDVNSIHHQGVDALGDGLQAVAWAEDGVIEAVEVAGAPWQRGVQFHPEDMRSQQPFQKLFDQLIADVIELRANTASGTL